MLIERQCNDFEGWKGSGAGGNLITAEASIDKKCHPGCEFLAKFPGAELPQKVMDGSYFAEIKGVVGC
jgi:hypothetical protein